MAGKATEYLGLNRLFCGSLEEKNAEGQVDKGGLACQENVENLSKTLSGCSDDSSKLRVCGFWLLNQQ